MRHANRLYLVIPFNVAKALQLLILSHFGGVSFCVQEQLPSVFATDDIKKILMFGLKKRKNTKHNQELRRMRKLRYTVVHSLQQNNSQS